MLKQRMEIPAQQTGQPLILSCPRNACKTIVKKPCMPGLFLRIGMTVKLIHLFRKYSNPAYLIRNGAAGTLNNEPITNKQS
jgi:hypothetical protein